MKTLFGWLRASFNPLERTLIDAVIERLSPKTAILFRRQVDEVTRVQRGAKHKDVNLYRGRRAVTSDSDSRFPLERPAKLATVQFRCSALDARLAAEFWIVEGVLFAIEFDVSPRRCSNADVTIDSVVVHVDPLDSDWPGRLDPIGPQGLTGWLCELSKKVPVDGMRRPLDAKTRDGIISNIDARLPSDYLELVAQTEGLHAGLWHVLGLSEIRQAIMPDKNYYILAEKEGCGVLALVRGDTSGAVYQVGYEDMEEKLSAKTMATLIAEDASA